MEAMINTICVTDQEHNLSFDGSLTVGGNAAMKETQPHAAIAARLRALRLAHGGPTIAVWAARHGFNHSQCGNWESGIRRIPLEAAELLSDRYGLSLDWIYRGRVDGLSENARKLLSSHLAM